MITVPAVNARAQARIPVFPSAPKGSLLLMASSLQSIARSRVQVAQIIRVNAIYSGIWMSEHARRNAMLSRRPPATATTVDEFRSLNGGGSSRITQEENSPGFLLPPLEKIQDRDNPVPQHRRDHGNPLRIPQGYQSPRRMKRMGNPSGSKVYTIVPGITLLSGGR